MFKEARFDLRGDVVKFALQNQKKDTGCTYVVLDNDKQIIAY
ncbi:hypothetical protein MNBD_GAMMA12-607 [hydrothermal vent metagenome]|uniref:Uncharacterized protein n=1 Tax=hydrothermal vent metagenome TaxID=652676 RepID=A0A3B0YFV5_9ZZZZ